MRWLEWIARVWGPANASRDPARIPQAPFIYRLGYAGLPFGRYTDRLRFVMLLANYEALRCGECMILPEHVWAAIKSGPYGVGRALLHFTSDYFSAPDLANPSQLNARTLRGQQKLLLHPSTRELIGRAADVAVAMGDNYCGTEHMVLALASLQHLGLAASLADAGIDLAGLRLHLRVYRFFCAGETALRNRDWDQAISNYRKGLELDPAQHQIANNLAWILATCPDRALRAGDEALRLMAFVERGQSDIVWWWMLGTVSAAYAEIADLENASLWGRRTMNLAPPAEAARWEARLIDLHKGLPIRDE